MLAYVGTFGIEIKMMKHKARSRPERQPHPYPVTFFRDDRETKAVQHRLTSSERNRRGNLISAEHSRAQEQAMELNERMKTAEDGSLGLAEAKSEDFIDQPKENGQYELSEADLDLVHAAGIIQSFY